MNSQEVLELNSKQVLKESFNFDGCRQSTHVILDIGPRFRSSGNDSVSTDLNTSVSSPEKSRVKKTVSSSKKGMTTILVREFNQPHHPVKILKDSFMVMFQMKYRERMNLLVPFTDKKREQVQVEMYRDLKFYCEFVTNGCTIYKKWIIKYSKMREDKYPAYMKGVVMDSLFSGQSFHSFIFPFLKELSEEPVRDMCDNIPNNLGI